MSEANAGGAAAAAPPSSSSGAEAISVPGQPAAANDNGQAEATPEPRHKVKIGGEEKDLTLAELTKLAEKGGGAEKAFREAAQLRKEVASYLDRLPQDVPGAIAQLIGDKSRAARHIMDQMMRDPSTRAELEAYLVETYEYEGLPHEERKRVDEHRDLKQKAEELERIKKADEERRDAEETKKLSAQFEAAFTKGLESIGWPVDEDTIPEMAIEAQKALDRGERITAAEIAKRLRDKHLKFARRVLPGLTADELADIVQEEGFGKLLKRDTERRKPKVPEIQRMPGNGKAKPANDNGKTPRKQFSSAALFRRIRGEG